MTGAEELLLRQLALALLVTEALELSCGWALGLRRGGLALAALINAVTNPALNLALALLRRALPPESLTAAVIIGELLVFAAEGAAYSLARLRPRVGPWTLSLILNALSLTAGSAILSLF